MPQQINNDQPAMNKNIDDAERERFSALAEEWWDPHGKFRPLHLFNPTRLSFLRGSLCHLLELDTEARKPLAGLRLLDIGCGGGLLSEPMARLGASVVGVDVSEKSIEAAKIHAREEGVHIDYRVSDTDELLKSDERFDVILNMEVVEHVPDPALLVHQCAQLLKPGGILFVATLNRTVKSFLLAIVGAEYVLGWLPKGTHQWNRFLAPREIQSMLTRAGMKTLIQTGITYAPLRGVWSLSKDTDVNYMICARKI